MHRRYLSILPAIALSMALAPAALADGPYVGAYAGASFLTDADNTGDPFVAGAGDVSVESEFDTGFAIGGVLGYAASNAGWNLRFEADVAYRRNALDSLSIDNDGGLGGLAGVGSLDGQSTSDVDGHLSALSGLVNVWFDIPVSATITPYLGGGVGVARVSASDLEALGVDLVDDSDVVFAWQVGAGVAWNVTPQMAVTLDYRYFGTEDPSFEFEPTGNSFDSEYKSHNVMAGLRYSF